MDLGRKNVRDSKTPPRGYSGRQYHIWRSGWPARLVWVGINFWNPKKIVPKNGYRGIDFPREGSGFVPFAFQRRGPRSPKTLSRRKEKKNWKKLEKLGGALAAISHPPRTLGRRCLFFYLDFILFSGQLLPLSWAAAPRACQFMGGVGRSRNLQAVFSLPKV